MLGSLPSQKGLQAPCGLGGLVAELLTSGGEARSPQRSTPAPGALPKPEGLAAPLGELLNVHGYIHNSDPDDEIDQVVLLHLMLLNDQFGWTCVARRERRGEYTFDDRRVAIAWSSPDDADEHRELVVYSEGKVPLQHFLRHLAIAAAFPDCSPNVSQVLACCRARKATAAQLAQMHRQARCSTSSSIHSFSAVGSRPTSPSQNDLQQPRLLQSPQLVHQPQPLGRRLPAERVRVVSSKTALVQSKDVHATNPRQDDSEGLVLPEVDTTVGSDQVSVLDMHCEELDPASLCTPVGSPRECNTSSNQSPGVREEEAQAQSLTAEVFSAWRSSCLKKEKDLSQTSKQVCEHALLDGSASSPGKMSTCRQHPGPTLLTSRPMLRQVPGFTTPTKPTAEWQVKECSQSWSSLPAADADALESGLAPSPGGMVPLWLDSSVEQKLSPNARSCLRSGGVRRVVRLPPQPASPIVAPTSPASPTTATAPAWRTAGADQQLSPHREQ